MSSYRRGAASRPRPTSPADGWAETRVEAAAPSDGWPATRLEPVTPNDGWATTRIGPTPSPVGWAETRVEAGAATKFLGDADDYLGTCPQDIGRLTSADVRELFVSCDPAEALHQQFEHLQPEFIAVHDIATASSRQLLQSVAAASGRQAQKLVIRRQGFGTALATIAFVDVPTADGKTLRLYSTAAEADPVARQALAQTLLGFARLGVVMVGDVPAHAMSTAFQPLRDAMASSIWRNRQLLLLPLAVASTLASHGIELGRAGGIGVRTTPQVVRPADAWSFITASWSRLGDPAAGVPPIAPSPAARGTGRASPLRLRDIPTTEAASAPRVIDAPVPGEFDRPLRQLGDVAGLTSACIFDVATGRVVAHVGASDVTQLALQGGQMLAAIGAAGRALGLGRAAPDAAITIGAHHLLLRGVPHRPGLALHAVLDAHIANLTLARLQLQRLDALFEPPGG